MCVIVTVDVTRNLLSHADPKDGDLSSEVPYGISTHPRIGRGMPWTRAYDQLGGLLYNELVEGDLVITKDCD